MCVGCWFINRLNSSCPTSCWVLGLEVYFFLAKSATAKAARGKSLQKYDNNNNNTKNTPKIGHLRDRNGRDQKCCR
jgi:hypothetical protein